MEYSIWAWVGFAIFILFMLSLDLGLLNRKAHAVTYREATIWSAVWVSLALVFGAGVFWRLGTETGLEFLTGYVIELSLSVDNLFVFLLIFSYFKVPSKYQHRVLFWGVLGALVMRILMIGIGAALIERFHWIIYVFGAFLVFTGLRMLRQDETEIQPEQNPLVRFVTRFIPITRHYEGEKFFTTVNGRRTGTLLLLVLVIVEVTDLVFAVDSIPAIFGVTTNTFIVYTSNVFAILGLRSLYFLLAGVVEKFHYLKIGLAIVLTFVGVKMLTESFVTNFIDKQTIIGISLGVVALVLLSSVAASLLWPKESETHVEVELPPGFGSPFDDDEGRLGAEEPTLNDERGIAPKRVS
ncbi:MAG: TerC family protein [Pyrinomonadaceae bacterium]|nr:TerC family protein [Pyrinomonadaceae bacterium]